MFLGPLILAIAWLCWRFRDQARELPAFGLALVMLLLVQVVLGGVTVLDQNSPWSVAVHLTTALLLFATMWLIFERAADRPTVLATRGLVPLALIGWLLLLATIASAAVMSKSGASLACSSLVLCEDGAGLNWGDELSRLHMTHRLLAVTTFFMLAFLGWRVRREERLRGLDRAIGLLLIIQITLGVLTVYFELPMILALLHQANGILLFAKVSWLLARILLARTYRAAEGENGRISSAAATS